MATTAGYPIIGSTSIWAAWSNYGSGAWNAWFIAPYGNWAYAGFVKSNVPYFKKINIGGADPNYPIIDWDFGVTSDSPQDIFPYERHEGYPNGSMGLGVIRGLPAKLYLGGRSSAGATITDTIIYRFPVSDSFALEPLGFIPEDDLANPMNINRICGLEVNPDAPDQAIYLVTNNDSGEEFTLWRYDYVWDDA